MKKSILRLGALALMSVVSMGAFATNERGEIFTGSDGNKYQIITPDASTGNATKGTVMLVKWVPGKTTTFGSAPIEDSYDYEFICTAIAGKGDCDESGYTNGAFDATNPGNVTINESVVTIGKGAFEGLTGNVIVELKSPFKITTLGENAFKPATGKKVELKLPEDASSVQVLKLNPGATLGKGAFEGVEFCSWTRAELGTTTTVKENLFKNSTNLKYVLFDGTNNLKTVEAGAFQDCETILWFGYYDNVNGAHFIPSTLSKVGSDAFNNAFANDPALEFMFSVPAKESNSAIGEVGARAFANCSWLDNKHFCNLFPAELGVAVGGGDYVKVKPFTFGAASFAGNATTHNALSGAWDFSEVTDATFNDAFKYNNIVSAVLNKKNVTKIGADAFEGCNLLTSVTGLDKVTEIEPYAFDGCTSLTTCDLTTAAELSKIGAHAFQNTDNYSDVWIPNTVAFIGADAFTRSNEASAVSRTISIIAKETTSTSEVSKPIESYHVISGVTYADAPICNYDNTTLVVPMGTMAKYATPAQKYNWSGAVGKLQTYLPKEYTINSVVYVGPYKYQLTETFNNVYTSGCPESPKVKLIGINTATSGYSGYTSTFGTGNIEFKLPQTICGEFSTHENNAKNFVYYTVVGTNTMDAMLGAKKTQVVSAQVAADKIDLTGVFKDCTNLASFKFQSFNVTNANYTGQLKPIAAETGWAGANSKPNEAKMGDSAFEDCVSLVTVEGITPDFIYTGTVLGNKAFAGCRNLASTVIPNNVYHIGQYAYDRTAISSVTLPEGLHNISAYAFANTKLTEISLPSTVATIEAYAFDGKLAEATEDELNEAGVRISGHIDGVSEVYAYWPDPTSVSIDANAFGVVAEDTNVGDDFHTVVRALYIPDGSYSVYAAKTPFQKMDKMFAIGEGIIAKTANNPTGRLDLVIDPRTGSRTLNIVDNGDITEFKISNPSQNAAVKYTRKVAKNVYNSLFVPFSVKGVGADYKIYKIFDTKVESDGTESIEYVALGEDEYTKPNVPYVIYPTNEQVELKAVAFENPIDHKKYTYFATPTDLTTPRVTCSDAKNSFAFYGTYTEKFGRTGMLATDGDAFYSLTSKNRFNLQNDGTKSVKALRFWMTITGKGADYYYVKRLELEDVTAIENLKANSLNAPMFDLMGRQITAPAKGQVYIQNGVKKLAK